jgi:hypothetical protein
MHAKGPKAEHGILHGPSPPIGGKTGNWPDHTRARVLLKQQLSPHPAADRGLGAAGALLQ